MAFDGSGVGAAEMDVLLDAMEDSELASDEGAGEGVDEVSSDGGSGASSSLSSIGRVAGGRSNICVEAELSALLGGVEMIGDVGAVEAGVV